ncbi:inhibitory POU protein isoform X2 [Macrosteles quadrilineatus]|uniref:inhibitory POU protein isoform X2 n=1 Tax=Macrosteles quadrilineatus TaxID=74068 RepID=UPI0023E20332|nr:inhibitory POU protein isoform X2 [Macrosteles quadrilineatus]
MDLMMYTPDKMMTGKSPLPISAPGPCFPGRYSPTYRSPDPMRRCMPNPSTRILEDASIMCNSWSPRHNGDLFSGLNDGLLSRAEALAAVDIGKHQPNPGPGLPQLKHDMMYHHGMAPGPPNTRPHQMSHHHGMEGLEMLDPISSSAMTTLTPMSEGGVGAGGHPQLHPPSVYPTMNSMMGGHHHHHHHHHGSPLGAHGPPGHHHHGHHPGMVQHPDADTDPRELEAFAERFKQRRIKLGVTQADVGKALANLKLPGVGALSQSTICRFESLTLSHNNMIALKPILQAWLEEAEAQAKNKRRDPDAPSVLPAGEKKRKRTSIAAPEKRSLEAYFAVQPRPSGEKIAAIAEKLDLKKNVVRVWFCNQRQKQKRMKFAAQH